MIKPFYEGNAWVYEGRYPTDKEYETGSAVCLAPRNFAQNNGLTVGDKVMTRLYYTYAGDKIDRFPNNTFTLLDLNGQIPEPFEVKEYTIVGLYDYKPLVEGIGLEELIVPMNSVENKTKNIIAYGAMEADNTSFRIENGTVADFLEISAKHGIDNLIFNFYDRGYSVLIQGIQNLKNMSAAMLVMGMIAAVVLTLQISHIYITKQKKRLAVERLIGMTAKRCRRISLLGILILLLLGTVPGVAAGMALTGEIGITGEEDPEQTPGENETGQETMEQTSGESGTGQEEIVQTPGESGTGQEEIVQTSGESATEQEEIVQTSGESATEQGAIVQTDTASEKFSRKYSNLSIAIDTDIDLTGQIEGDPVVSAVMGGLVVALGMVLSGIKMRRVLRGEPLYLMEDSTALR